MRAPLPFEVWQAGMFTGLMLGSQGRDQLARLVDDIANLTHVAPPVDAERKAYAS